MSDALDCPGDCSEAGRMRRRKAAIWRSRPAAAAMVVGAGLAVGAVASTDVAAWIRDARPPFGARLSPRPVPAGGTPADPAMGSAVAAAVRVRSLADCRALAPQYRSGCRSYLERREEVDAMLNSALREPGDAWPGEF